MSKETNGLILGCAFRLAAVDCRVFCNSLVQTGYCGRVVLLVTPDDLAVLASVVPRSVELRVPPASGTLARAMYFLLRGARRVYPRFYQPSTRVASRLLRGMGCERARRDLETLQMGPQATRYHWYAEIMPEDDSIPVMLTDVRDVLFLRNPFVPHPRGLHIFYESVRFCDSEPNNEWTRDLYGEAQARAVRSDFVSCCGTVLGTAGAVMDYCRQLDTELMRHGIPLGPRDQAAHNFLLREGRLREVTRHSNGYGGVLTLPRLKLWPWFGSDGWPCNPDKTQPAVIHQYDRYPELLRAARARFGLVEGNDDVRRSSN